VNRVATKASSQSCLRIYFKILIMLIRVRYLSVFVKRPSLYTE
jgi:hypothetical protein